MMTHTLSLWSLDAEFQFDDTAPCYQSPLLSEAQARFSYAAATYHTAAGADTWADKAPAYLVSLDRFDAAGGVVSEQCRQVSDTTFTPNP